jgi:hypothetical protein
VNIPLKSEKDTQATIRYACPVAAWKPRYSFNLEKGKATLLGQAIVDNDTEDDWNNTTITVVTGEPITFSTDLAEARRPNRSRVNLVNDKAQGAVNAETPLSRPKRVGSPLRAASAKMSGMESSIDTLDDEPAYGGSGPENYTSNAIALNLAHYPEAEVAESGDFSAFTSPNPVTIRAKQSAIIPLFSKELSEAKTILFYKDSSQRFRPYRAVKFKNETSFTLSKGECEIENNGDFQGKCVLDSIRPNETGVLIHAVETGVTINKVVSPPERRTVKIQIQKGVAAFEFASKSTTNYTILNNKDEDFELEIEHPKSPSIPNSKLEITGVETTTVETKTGWRLTLKLPANSEIQLNAVEIGILQQGYDFTRLGCNWIENNLVAVQNPIIKDKSLNRVLSLHEKVKKTENEIDVVNESIDNYKDEQKRLLSLIPAGNPNDVEVWRNELGESERELKRLQREQLPELSARLEKEQQAVTDALLKLTATWSEDQENQ